MAIKYLSNNTAKEIVRNQNNESIEVWKGVRALIETDYVWGSFIIEGIAILPHLVKKLSVKNKEIRVVFLMDDDLERIRKTIFTRGLFDDAEKYSDEVKDKEVKWVLEFNNYLIKEAKIHNFPIVRAGDRKRHISQIKEIIK